MTLFKRITYHPFFIRLFNWEYWSFSMVYIWIYPVWFLFCLRARSFFFFAASNPGFRNGGFLNESKKDLHALIPSHMVPATLFFSLPVNAGMVIQNLAHHNIRFPMIGKPDVGGRGRGVKALKNEEDLRKYLQQVFLDFHIQEFVPYKNEVGIFYYRYPGSSSGEISGIVKKDFLSVTGDGKQTLEQLLKYHKRAILQRESLKRIYGEGIYEVIPDGEMRVLVPYGNHSRGAKFLDDSHLVDERLTATIDSICQQIKGFYFGRLDLRYNTWEELKEGKNFSIIEVNGAGSEPTHIYDPRHSLFFAWREIIRHWRILCRISRMNHKLGHPYMSIKDGIAMFREDKIHSVKLAAMME